MKERHSNSSEFKLHDDLAAEMRYTDDTTVMSTRFNGFEMVTNELKEA